MRRARHQTPRRHRSGPGRRESSRRARFLRPCSASRWAELTVNEAGFPLKVVVGERVESGEIITDFVYRDGRYEETIRWPETELSVDLRIPGHGADDEPRGVYTCLTQIADQRLTGVEEIEVGGEMVLARRFEIQGPFRNGYVDALGRVLLLQHDPGSGMERPQHIRMLRPSEF